MGRPKNYKDTNCLICNILFYRRTHGRLVKPKYCSSKCYWKSGNQYFKKGHKVNINRKQSKEVIEAKRKKLQGHLVSLKTRKKISDKLKGHIPWNKGIKSLSSTRKIKNCWKGRIWSKVIIARDKKCVICGSTKKLEADHIKPVLYFPELAYEPSNGRVLCKDCHKKTDTYGGRLKTYAYISR